MTLWDHVLHLHKDINHHWIFSKQLLQYKCAVAKQLQCGCESPPCTTDTVLPSVTNSSRWLCWFWRSLSDDALNFELLLVLQPSKDFLDGWEDIYKLQFGINDSIKVQLTYSVISGILASSEKYLCLFFSCQNQHQSTSRWCFAKRFVFLFSFSTAVVLTRGRIVGEYLYVSLSLSHLSCSGVRV